MFRFSWWYGSYFLVQPHEQHACVDYVRLHFLAEQYFARWGESGRKGNRKEKQTLFALSKVMKIG